MRITGPNNRGEIVTNWCKLFIYILSAIVISSIIIDYGFELHISELNIIHSIYRFAWWFYLVLYLLMIIFKRKYINRRTLFFTIFVALLLFLSIIGSNFNFSHIINRFFLFVFSIIELSRGIINLIGKKTNPALVLSLGFLFIILVGAILLMVPRSTLPHLRISVVDALFVSTSAVGVTGLSPVEISSTFTLAGQVIILVLIQIGALGVMTITSIFTLFFMGETSLSSQLVLRDMVGSERLSSLISTLLYILGFTFVIELAGVGFVWLSVHDTLGYTLEEELFFSIFHSISAFCNAGFSTLDGNLGNVAVMRGNNLFYVIISILVILGGIGFPILVNFKKMLFYYIKWFAYRVGIIKNRPLRYLHLTNLNTKIVIYSTICLIVIGTLLIAVIEWNSAFASMDTIEKIIQSLFNAVVPRTAGFNSVDLTSFSFLTIIIYTFLMWVGGASQSTAGGIKVNTFMVAIANFISILGGKENVQLYGREINTYSVRRVGAIIFGSLATILLFWSLLILIEYDIKPHKLLFETVSAISTVGSSLGVTPHLKPESKILLSLLMFIGRVGLITVLTGLMEPGKKQLYRYPSENVIIN